LEKEVSKKKAKFSQTITHNADSSITEEIEDLRMSRIIKSETYKGDEPFGVWKYQKDNEIVELNYNFNLNYNGKTCVDSISGIKDYFKNNDSLKYIAPKIAAREESGLSYILRHMRYPAPARENGISGRVYIHFSVTTEGTVDDITIIRGVNILLDKDAARVLHELKFSSPALLNGEPQKLCMILPLSFHLQ
jgi:protein TonB